MRARSLSTQHNPAVATMASWNNANLICKGSCQNYTPVNAIDTHVPPPHSTMKPGSPIPVNINNPGVRKAARFGVYRYNNSSNDLFLFKDSQINKAMVQIVRGLKYMLHVEIKRTVCEKREHSSLDGCHFQRKKSLQQRHLCWAYDDLTGRSRGVMVSTPDSGSQGREFESQWRPYRAVKCLPAIRSHQILDAQQGQAWLVLGAVDSPEDFTVTVQARSAVADGLQD
ncbi:hypothetical protein WISP_87660 [Willisornis vidua]|uniref:Cystatin domain-containing protein n=1 Tax=Willisornis vidua TaxID=1566151 RepID=A0ABQ9D2L3_9PASS|nr:hypothetical protein WISP_87660 [Willisornis vidua]